MVNTLLSDQNSLAGFSIDRVPGFQLPPPTLRLFPRKIHCLTLPTLSPTLADLYPLSLVGSHCCTGLLSGNFGTRKRHPTKPEWNFFFFLSQWERLGDQIEASH